MDGHKTAIEVLAEWDAAERADRYPHSCRILTAMRLATDLETCRDLLAGEPVPPERLDPDELREAKNRRLVRLDMAAIDQLEAA